MSYLYSPFSVLRFYKDWTVSAFAYLIASRTHSAMSSLTHLEPIVPISGLVTRILGHNPGPFTLQGTNTYLVGSGKKKILIDTGEPGIEEYIRSLTLALNEAEIDSIVITHWHNDHVGGIPAVVKEIVGKKIPVYKVRRDHAEEDPSQFEYVQDGHVLKVEGATLRFVFTPGHTVDHAALWLEEEQTLFSGDCILGEGTTIFECLHDYMKSLQVIRDMKPKRIYPGHGPVIEEVEKKIEEYVEHRMKREREIVAVLKEAGEMTSMDITNKVYAEAPWSVRLAALNNVKLHLNKLIKDGRVDKIGFEMYKYLKD
ncbi:hypothetical protein WR25_15852 [Diploscapter pachys]|uniref:Beta-lactamase-like protein 2 homolog n=1 Tax=Diploscapter pachys TaxID=2018661 RepID=A0A2A2J7Z3_9BILA|nr:hypothetical protein WR25_15852 [Diploscapter pachys]